MKIKKEKTISLCDECGVENSYMDSCLCCGKEMCFNCWKKRGKSYNHGVFFAGSGDGYYCNECDKKLTEKGSDKQHKAYRNIASLREEYQTWHLRFKERATEAENNLKKYAKSL